jgi:hypothetical protein
MYWDVRMTSKLGKLDECTMTRSMRRRGVSAESLFTKFWCYMQTNKHGFGLSKILSFGVLKDLFLFLFIWQRSTKTTSAIAAVEVEPPGCSFNPPREAHQVCVIPVPKHSMCTVSSISSYFLIRRLVGILSFWNKL